MEPHSRNHSALASVRRKRLRESASIFEDTVWEFLRKDRIGYRFRRQISIDRFYVDFYCAAAQLAVEVDGEQHERSREYDQERDRRLGECGIEVIRVPSLDFFEDGREMNRTEWIEHIAERCSARVEEFNRIREARRRAK